MKIFLTENLDPWFNLAFENWLFRRKDLTGQDILILWRNNPSVIIGRFQNPWLECRLQKMHQNRISFARRESGGGAVYHDPGNTNFSFIADNTAFSKDSCTEMIAQSLETLGIQVDQGERNDLYVKGKKVSGSASKYSSGRVLHHGTLLLNADLIALNHYLTAEDYKSGKLKSLGTPSVSSGVMNLSEIDNTLDHKRVCRAIIEKSGDYYGKGTEVSLIRQSDMEKIDEVVEYRLKIMSWDWLYGSTPGFTLTTTTVLAGIDTICTYSVKKGIIRGILFDDKSISENRKKTIERDFLGKHCDILLTQRSSGHIDSIN